MCYPYYKPGALTDGFEIVVTFRLNNIVQYCRQLPTMWAEKHYSVLLYCRLKKFRPYTCDLGK